MSNTVLSDPSNPIYTNNAYLIKENEKNPTTNKKNNYKKIALTTVTVLATSVAIAALVYFSPILLAGLSAKMTTIALSASGTALGLITTAAITAIHGHRKTALTIMTSLVATTALAALVYFSPILFAGLSATMAPAALATASAGLGIISTIMVEMICRKQRKNKNIEDKQEQNLKNSNETDRNIINRNNINSNLSTISMLRHTPPAVTAFVPISEKSSIISFNKENVSSLTENDPFAIPTIISVLSQN